MSYLFSFLRTLAFVVFVFFNFLSANAQQSAKISPLAGTYSVGGPNASYASITAAINDLKLNGMSAAVVLDVNPAFGPYIDQVNVENITGLNANATLTLKGNNAILKNAISGTSNVYILKIATSYVVVDGFNFEVFDGNSSDRNVAIICTQNSNFNQIINNKFKLKKTFSTNNQIGIYFNGALSFTNNIQGDYRYNIIENNEFEGAKYPICIIGKTASTLDRGNQIKNNRFADFTSAALYTSHADSTVVNQNEVFQTTAFKASPHTGIVRFVHVINAAENLRITNNIVHDVYNKSPSSVGGLQVFYFQNCGVFPAGKEAIIENNIVYNAKSKDATVFCYVLGTCNGIRVLHNSFAMESDIVCNIFFFESVPNSNNNHFYNNLYNATNQFYSILFGSSNSTAFNGLKSDYNAYCSNTTSFQFSPSHNYAGWNSTYKADSNSIFISQINLNAPYYLVPDSFSTLVGAGKNVSTGFDYWQNPRNDLKPSIGAFEKPYADNVGPAIQLYKINSTLSKNSRTITNILQYFDPAGIDTSFGIRFYYKKRSDPNKISSNTNADEGWKFANPKNKFGIYLSYYLNYQLFKDSIVNIGDTIDYFVLGKDALGNYSFHNNAISNPFILNLGVEQLIKRVSPEYYVISEIIPDTVFVGSSHIIKSLSNEKGLFIYLKHNYANKPVQVLIDSDLTESGTYALEEIQKVNGKSGRLFIDAHLNKALSIQGSYKGGLIRFEGIDSVYWSGNSDSILVSNNYYSLKNDTIAAFHISSNNMDQYNSSNSILIKNTRIQTNPNSIYTTGIFVGLKKGLLKDQNYNDLTILNNTFSKAKNGIIFSYSRTSPYAQFANCRIIGNKFEFDSLVNIIHANRTSSLLIKGNEVHVNYLGSNSILTDIKHVNSQLSVLFLNINYGITTLSSNKIVLKNTKDDLQHVVDIITGYNIDINNNIIDVDLTNFNINRPNFYRFKDLDMVNYTYNASIIRNQNFDNSTDDVCFLSLELLDSLKLMNNQFINLAKHQSLKTNLIDFINARPPVFIRNNYISKVYYTESYFLNAYTTIKDFQQSLDPLMNFIDKDANIHLSTYKSQNNSLIAKGIKVPGVLFDFEGKARNAIPTVGPFELDSIKKDVELVDILMDHCVDTADLNYKLAVVIRNNASYIDSALLKIKISGTDTSQLHYQYVCASIKEHSIDTVFIPFASIRNFVTDSSLNASLILLNDQNTSNNSMQVNFVLGYHLMSTYIDNYTDTLCSNAEIEIGLKDELDRTYKWYDAPEYGNLIFEGKKYVTDNTGELKLYAEVQQTDLVEKKSMPLVSGYSANGLYFTIKNTSNALLNLKYLSLQIWLAGHYNNTKVYVKQGTYSGFESNASVWTVKNVRVINTYNGYLAFEFIDDDIHVVENDSISFYVHIGNTSGTFINENITNGINKFDAQDFEINYGVCYGGTQPFVGNIVSNKRPSIKVYYSRSDRCNKSSRVPISIQKQKSIIAKINPSSFNIIEAAGTLSNPDVICFHSDNKYNIKINPDFNNYTYNVDWVITRKEIRYVRFDIPIHTYTDTSKSIIIDKGGLLVDSVYRLIYYYKDNVSGCMQSLVRYFKYGKSIQKSMVQTGLIKKCSFDTLVLRAFHTEPYFKYSWSTGDTTRSIKVLNAGKYFLTTYFPLCFQKTDSVIVEILPQQDSIVMNISQMDSCNFKYTTDITPNFTVEWDFGDGEKAIGYEVFHKYDFNATYKVQARRMMTVPYCLKKNISEQYLSVSCMPMGIKDEESDLFKIYPNPSSNTVSIESTEDIESIVLYDINGRLIAKYQDTIINMQGLSNGVYILEIIANNKVYRRRVLKN